MTKKKQPSNKRLLSAIQSSNRFILALGLVIIFGFGIFAYNKYLDWRNTEDMKRLLADFEQLEKDVEKETGEEFYIEADCGSVGKFATSYACSVYLKNNLKLSPEYSLFINSSSSLNKSSNDCRAITDKNALFRGFFACTISVPNPLRESAQAIFSE